jgi:hypothetical protein
VSFFGDWATPKGLRRDFFHLPHSTGQLVKALNLLLHLCVLVVPRTWTDVASPTRSTKKKQQGEVDLLSPRSYTSPVTLSLNVEVNPMSASPSNRQVRLLFAAALVCALAFAFCLGHLIGRWAERAAKSPTVHSPARTS